MEGCEGVAGVLEERRQWLTQAAEQAEKDKVHAESQVQAAKKSLASENDIRVGSREVRCSLSPPARHGTLPQLRPKISYGSNVGPLIRRHPCTPLDADLYSLGSTAVFAGTAHSAGLPGS